jgi:hypothetical protein
MFLFISQLCNINTDLIVMSSYEFNFLVKFWGSYGSDYEEHSFGM